MRLLTPTLLGRALLVATLPLYAVGAPATERKSLPAGVKDASPRYSLAEQVAAEVATILCEDPGYQRCAALAQDRCMLEMGLIANRCASAAETTGDTQTLAATLTRCLINEHARLLDFEPDGLLSCYADGSVTP